MLGWSVGHVIRKIINAIWFDQPDATSENARKQRILSLNFPRNLFHHFANLQMIYQPAQILKHLKMLPSSITTELCTSTSLEKCRKISENIINISVAIHPHLRGGGGNLRGHRRRLYLTLGWVVEGMSCIPTRQPQEQNRQLRYA